MITRILHSFADSGVITLARERITIIDESALKDISEN